jgi:Uma2 family endonuclease
MASFTSRSAPSAHPFPVVSIGGLETGDELTRDEFERRYRGLTDVKKAELVEGIVYTPSPVRYDKHGVPHARLMGLLSLYEWQTPGVLCCDNTTVRLDLKNEPQPDALLLIDPQCGGNVKFNEGYIEGAPELVAEIASSSVSLDMNAKLRAYHRNQVREYLVWRVDDHALDWFRLEGSEYVSIQPNEQGWLCSTAFPGLWLDAQALLDGKLDKVRASLEAGLSHESHARFVEMLQANER